MTVIFLTLHTSIYSKQEHHCDENKQIFHGSVTSVEIYVYYFTLYFNTMLLLSKISSFYTHVVYENLVEIRCNLDLISFLDNNHGIINCTACKVTKVPSAYSYLSRLPAWTTEIHKPWHGHYENMSVRCIPP